MKVLRLLLPLLLVVLAGCASAPVQEMSDARQAIDAAMQVEAEKHAPELISRAKKGLNAAENALKNGEWQKARESALQARTDAIAARARAVAGDSEN